MSCFTNVIMLFFRTVAQRYYVGTYNTSEKHYPLPEDPPPYLWGRLNNKEIQFHVVKSQDDVQKRLRCKFTVIYVRAKYREGDINHDFLGV